MPLIPITVTGSGSTTRIPPDKAVSGGVIPTDPIEAGLPAGTSLSPDPTTAATQLVSVLVRT